MLPAELSMHASTALVTMSASTVSAHAFRLHMAGAQTTALRADAACAAPRMSR